VISDLILLSSELLKEMRLVNQTYSQWKELCKHGSAPQINAAAADVREHVAEADELLDEMQKANGKYLSILSIIFDLYVTELVTLQFISRWKNGHTNNFSFQSLVLFLNYFVTPPIHRHR
jgi:nitrate/nitrite-specific signal transduction histidine kinase